MRYSSPTDPPEPGLDRSAVVVDSNAPPLTMSRMATFSLPAAVELQRRELHGLLDRAVHHQTDGRRYSEAGTALTRHEGAVDVRSALFQLLGTYLVFLDKVAPQHPDGTPPSVAGIRRLIAAGAAARGMDTTVAALTTAVRDGSQAEFIGLIHDNVTPSSQTVVLLTMFAVAVELVEWTAADRSLPASMVLELLAKQFA
jgi:hypothetical protein